LPPLQVKHGKNTYSKGMGLNEWNIDIETKKKIRLEHGKEDVFYL
jgi:hypothetical protein